ncbi:hypothetical protein HDU83_001560 [Entophlyctis luteolus]|nr:hypothetical protein HDU83_001560 [Entophlyctis luteolus]
MPKNLAAEQIAAAARDRDRRLHDSTAPTSGTDDRELRRVVAVHAMRILGGPKGEADDISIRAQPAKDSRINAITSLTARMLSVDICILSVIDANVVRFWSICDTSKQPFFPASACADPFRISEPRNDSFCQYTIREDCKSANPANCGFVVLDASREPKFKNKPLVKSGLCFYAGAPIVTNRNATQRAGVKIGALSIRGPARAQFTSQEAKMLRQMTEWAVGEIEVYALKREFDFAESLRLAIARINQIRDELEAELAFDVATGFCGAAAAGGFGGRSGMKQCLEIARSALKLKNAMILRIKRAQSGAMSSVVFALADLKCDLKLGDERFGELCQSTLDNTTQHPYVLSKDSASHLQVCRFIGETVHQTATELIWSHGRPVGVLALFFEGVYKSVNALEEKFLSDLAVALSRMWQMREAKDSLSKAMSTPVPLQQILSKSSGGVTSLQPRPPVRQASYHSSRRPFSFSLTSLKASGTLPPGTDSLSQSTLCSSREVLAQFVVDSKVFVLVCEPVIPVVRGNRLSECTANSSARPPRASQSMSSLRSGEISCGRERSKSKGSVKSRSSLLSDQNERNESMWGGTASTVISLTPRSAIELFADFSQMFVVICEQHGLSGKKFGNIFVAASGALNSDSASWQDLFKVAVELSQTVREYQRETGISDRRSWQSITTEPFAKHKRCRELLGFAGSDEDIVTMSDTVSPANFAYHLEKTSTSSLSISEFVYVHAEIPKAFSVRGTSFVSGVGAFPVYSIALSEFEADFEKIDSKSIKSVASKQPETSYGFGDSANIDSSRGGWRFGKSNHKVAPENVGRNSSASVRVHRQMCVIM